jgi:UDP-N-acetylglucosamine 1-carboxyvinyltransferase
MDRIKIHGGVKLQGKVRIQGSKNAALPILAAVLMTEGETVLYNVPKISDVDRMLKVLSCMGCSIRYSESAIRIQNCCRPRSEIPEEVLTGMRSSMYMLGVCLGIGQSIEMHHPGGCVIGARPVDMHLCALEKMVARFEVKDDKIFGEAPAGLRGTRIDFRFPSVGATENVILAAVLARGTTVVYGAAKEPEVVALCNYLNTCGAKIRGIGTEILWIEGVSGLRGCVFYIPGDRIVAGTYMLMTAMTGGCGLFEGAPIHDMVAVLSLLRRSGCEYQFSEEGIYVQAPEKLLPVRKIVTEVYPGFPTDLQSQAMVMALKIPGETVIEENIFEDRFLIVSQLQMMGADIRIRNRKTALVQGANSLKGQLVEARELRGGAALIAAGLIAEEVTAVEGCQYIDRGYENICKDLRELGARIYRDK